MRSVGQTLSRFHIKQIRNLTERQTPNIPQDIICILIKAHTFALRRRLSLQRIRIANINCNLHTKDVCLCS